MSRHYQFIFRRFEGVTPFSFVSGSPLAVGIFAWVVMWVVSLSSLLPLDWRSEHDRLDSRNEILDVLVLDVFDVQEVTNLVGRFRSLVALQRRFSLNKEYYKNSLEPLLRALNVMFLPDMT